MTAIPSVPNGYIFKAFGTTSAAVAAGVTQFNWDFGDGHTCAPCGDQVSWIYADSKNYAVTLSVPNVQGSVQHKIDDKFRRRPSTPP